MKRTIRFYKEYDHRWFADIPEWNGDKDDLEMVSNADIMLDIISQGDENLHLTLSTESIGGFDVLDLESKCPEPQNGAYYIMKSYRGIDFDLKMWLCDVTKFVFGDFPEKIYIHKK